MMLLNRPDMKGLAANIFLPVLATLIVNAIIFTQGWDQRPKPLLDSLWFAPPGWAIGIIWIFLYGLYGLSRWTAATATEDANKRAWAIVALMLWGLSYPWLSQKFDLTWGAYMNVASLLLTLMVAAFIWPVSKKAVYWLLPSMLWESFAVFLGFAALSVA
ncbi:MAG: tryptophan-rich sensory protein [Pseudomonadota bacterium]